MNAYQFCPFYAGKTALLIFPSSVVNIVRHRVFQFGLSLLSAVYAFGITFLSQTKFFLFIIQYTVLNCLTKANGRNKIVLILIHLGIFNAL